MARYLLPGHPNADRHLKDACKIAHPILSRFYLQKHLLCPGTKITYGYLGRVAKTRLTHSGDQADSILKGVYILDHPFTPANLRNKIYRVSRIQDNSLQIVRSPSDSFVTTNHKNQIYEHIKEVSGKQHVRLFATNATSALQDVSIMIDPSPVLAAILEFVFTPQKYHAMFFSGLNEDHEENWIISSKEQEVLVDSIGNTQYRHNHGSYIVIPFSDIRFAFCPSSLIAFNFLLKGIPVSLSPLHPYNSLVNTCSGQTKQEAADMIYDLTVHTSVSLEKLRAFEESLC